MLLQTGNSSRVSVRANASRSSGPSNLCKTVVPPKPSAINDVIRGVALGGLASVALLTAPLTAQVKNHNHILRHSEVL